MHRKEKILLLEILMTDIRMAWGKEPYVRKRKAKCLELAKDLQFDKTIELLNRYDPDIYEGRLLRCNFKEEGGYEDIELEHGVTYDENYRYSFINRSKQFQEDIKSLIVGDIDTYFYDIKKKPHKKK